MNRDYYKILGISKEAEQKEIKEAYQKLVKEYHPDRYRNNPLQGLAEEKLKEINEAWEILGDLEKRKKYDEGIFSEPDLTEITILNLFRNGEEFFARRQFDSARMEYEKIINIDPHITDPYILIAMCYKNQDKFDKAIVFFKKFLDFLPDSHETYNQIGICYLNTNNIEEAIVNYKIALEISPSESIYHENLGHAYYQVKNIEKAIDCFLDASRLAPDRAEIYMNLCFIYSETGRHELSENYFNIAKKLDPSHPLVIEWENTLNQYKYQQQQYITTTGNSSFDNEANQLLTCLTGCCIAALMETICPGSSHCLRCGG